jgi:hypothetical protein
MSENDTKNDPEREPTSDEPASEEPAGKEDVAGKKDVAAKEAPADKPADDPQGQDDAPIDDLEAAWQAAGDQVSEQNEAATEAASAAEEEEEEEVDPELLRLPKPRRRRRHPIVSLIVIGMSIYLMVFSWTDFRYFFEGNTPRDLGHVTEAITKGFPQTNVYVTVRGAPDRKHALLLQGRVSGYESFFRLRQGRNLVYVQQHRLKRDSQRAIKAEHVGRLVRFGSLPYKAAIRRFFKKSMNVAHDLDFAAVGRAKAGKKVVDKQGLSVSLDPKKLVWINARYPDEWIIQFPKSIYATRAEARKQLATLSLPVAPEDEPSPSFWRFVVLAKAEQARQLISVFSKPKLRTNVLKRQVSYSARWDQLRVEGKTLIIDAKDDTFPSRYVRQGDKLVAQKPHPVRIESSALLYFSTSSTYTIPANAVVIHVGQVPRDSWLYVLLYTVLGCFVLFNLLAIVQRLRQR